MKGEEKWERRGMEKQEGGRRKQDRRERERNRRNERGE